MMLSSPTRRIGDLFKSEAATKNTTRVLDGPPLPSPIYPYDVVVVGGVVWGWKASLPGKRTISGGILYTFEMFPIPPPLLFYCILKHPVRLLVMRGPPTITCSSGRLMEIIPSSPSSTASVFHPLFLGGHSNDLSAFLGQRRKVALLGPIC